MKVGNGGSATVPRPWLGLGVAAIVPFLAVLPTLLGLGQGESGVGTMAAIILIGLISGLMVAKRPDHPISWLLAGAAGAGGIAGFANQVLGEGLTQLTWWQATLAVISGPAWYGILLSVLVLIPLLFPTGTLPSPRWRWVVWVVGISAGIFGLLWVFQTGFCTNWDGDEVCLTMVPNPIGLPGIGNPEDSLIGSVLYGILLVAAVAALASLILRFRRSGAVERQQLKWVAFSVSLFVLSSVLVETVWIDLLGNPEPPGYWLAQEVMWVMIPGSIALAVLRYRLFEIDRIVSRTVTYSLVAVVLAGVFAAVVVGLQTLLPRSNDLSVAASTLVVAALFSPLRKRVQGMMDRRFNRRRYNAEHVIEGFTARLRDTVDLNRFDHDLRDLVIRTMEPAVVSVWLKQELP